MAFINDNQIWDFQVEDCYFVDNADFSGSRFQPLESSRGENISYTWDGENTAVKGVVEHAYIAENIKNKNKRRKQCEPWSQTKRRHVMQFDSEVVAGLFCTDESNSSDLMTSNEAGDSVNEVLSQMSHWLYEDADGISSCQEVLGQSFEGWLSSCLTNSGMEFNPFNMDISGQSIVHDKADGTQNLRYGLESTKIPDHSILIRHNSNFKGKKSFMQTSITSPTSIVYPFTFLKPCGFRGDVTLNDINRRLHAKPKSQENPISYSAFSGKPVVAKTTICTGGGKGSITIMRTEG